MACLLTGSYQTCHNNTDTNMHAHAHLYIKHLQLADATLQGLEHLEHPSWDTAQHIMLLPHLVIDAMSALQAVPQAARNQHAVVRGKRRAQPQQRPVRPYLLYCSTAPSPQTQRHTYLVGDLVLACCAKPCRHLTCACRHRQCRQPGKCSQVHWLTNTASILTGVTLLVQPNCNKQALHITASAATLATDMRTYSNNKTQQRPIIA